MLAGGGAAGGSPQTRQVPATDAGPDLHGAVPIRRRRLPKTSRIRLRKDFDTVFAAGQRVQGSYATLLALATDRRVAQFGLVTGKQLGNAVRRHRAKRRLFEWARERYDHFPRGVLLVIVARPAVLTADHASLSAALDRLLERVLARLPDSE